MSSSVKKSCSKQIFTFQKCTHGRHYSNSIQKQPIQYTTDQNTNCLTHQDQDNRRKPISITQDDHTKQLRYLINSNSNYFQNKIKISNNSKPNQYRLKIPCSTGCTTYNTNFMPKNINQEINELKLNSNVSIHTDGKNKLPFEGQSTYQSCYVLKPNIEMNILEEKKVRKGNKLMISKKKIEKEVPRFMDTHNKMNFLNWGGDYHAPSMKPQQKIAGSNLPFQGKSTYNSQFKIKKQCIPNSKIERKSSFPSFMNMMMTKNSVYENQFQGKENQEVEKSCKPEQKPIINLNPLRGITEYKDSFQKIQNRKQEFHWLKKSQQELQNIIIRI